MKKLITTVLAVFLSVTMIGINAKQKKEKMTFILIETNLGEIKVALYNETPLHRDNFIKLVEENFYDGVLFHRVIKEFMIQAGDPQSKTENNANLQLGAGDVRYKIPAEIVFPQLYHKRGALAAARQGDMYNPKRESSGCQFYIVQGKTFTDEELDLIEKRINSTVTTENPFQYTAEQRTQYKTFGGTPFLDGQYTVFGEVIEGYDILQKISEVETKRGDRPVEDVKIINTRIVKK